MYTPYDKEKYPERKNPRLKDYDYSTPNYYFVTVCTDGKRCLFGQPGKLGQFGKIAYQGILEISKHYPESQVDKFVVMPNHVHVILRICGGKAKLDHMIGSYKAYVTKEIHISEPNLKVWQASFHDHIIRSQKAYENIWLYIDGNPMNWEKDCFYTE